MADARVTINSLNGGEISPLVSYKKDLAKVQNGAALLENAVVMVYGGAQNRAGLSFVCEVKDSSKLVELRRFEVQGDDAMLVEVGEEYFRYVYQGAQVTDGGIVETETPYAEEDIADVKMDQSNDVATVVNNNYRPYELSREGASTFTFEEASFIPAAQPPAAAPTITIELEHTPAGSVGDAAKQYDYAVSTIAATGEESVISASETAEANFLGYNKNWNDISWPAVAGAAEYAIYKKTPETDFWGYIGRATGTTFRDDGIAPSTADGPQSGVDPFPDSSTYPGLVTFVQQRRTFSKIASALQTIRMSQSGAFSNFGTSTPLKDDDAVEFTLAARRKQDINHIVPLEKGMIVFTRAGEWRVTGRADSVITPSSIQPEPQSYWGSDPAIEPIIVGEQLIFATRTGRQLRDLEYSVAIDRYKSTELTLMAEHLFRGKRIIRVDYAKEPDGLVFCVLDDGTAAVLTYLREHDVWGWSRMNTQGRILDVKVISERGRDVPYFLVERRIDGETKKYIEYMKPREFVDVKDAFFVDSGLTYDAPIILTAVTVGETPIFTAPGHGLSVDDEVELDGVTLEDSGYNAVASYDGRYFVASVDGDDFTVVDRNSEDARAYTRTIETKEKVYIDHENLASTGYYSGGKIRKGVNTISGLDHLEGAEVSALCDGYVVSGHTVDGGSVTFETAVFRAHIGLKYICKIETLDPINPKVQDAGIIKNVGAIYAEVYETRGAVWGPNFEDMEPLEDRSYEDYDENPRTVTGPLEITFLDNWALNQHVCLKQEMPLPLTLQKLTREIEYGG